MAHRPVHSGNTARQDAGDAFKSTGLTVDLRHSEARQHEVLGDIVEVQGPVRQQRQQGLATGADGNGASVLCPEERIASQRVTRCH
jgi:hypothetical protein